MKARVLIRPRSDILDPQGQAVGQALAGLGFAGVRDVRQGKIIEMQLDRTDRAGAVAVVEEMCARLLVNDVIESADIDIIDDSTG